MGSVRVLWFPPTLMRGLACLTWALDVNGRVNMCTWCTLLVWGLAQGVSTMNMSRIKLLLTKELFCFCLSIAFFPSLHHTKCKLSAFIPKHKIKRSIYFRLPRHYRWIKKCYRIHIIYNKLIWLNSIPVTSFPANSKTQWFNISILFSIYSM